LYSSGSAQAYKWALEIEKALHLLVRPCRDGVLDAEKGESAGNRKVGIYQPASDVNEPPVVGHVDRNDRPLGRVLPVRLQNELVVGNADGVVLDLVGDVDAKHVVQGDQSDAALPGHAQRRGVRGIGHGAVLTRPPLKARQPGTSKSLTHDRLMPLANRQVLLGQVGERVANDYRLRA
jgi:hypothetical protein